MLVRLNMVERCPSSDAFEPEGHEIQCFIIALEQQFCNPTSDCWFVHDSVATETASQDKIGNHRMPTDDSVPVKCANVVVASPRTYEFDILESCDSPG